MLAQVELPLALGKLPLHLGLNPVAQVEQFQLAREMAVDHGEARLPIGLFQQLLPLRMGERGQVAGREIRQLARLGNVKRAFRQIVGQVGRRRHDLLEQADHVLPQRFHLAGDFGLHVGHPFHAGAQERVGGRELARANPRDAFAE